jgi:hypothetical protein
VKEKDIIIIEHMYKGFLIGTVTDKYSDVKPIWPRREDNEVYPYRVKFETLDEFAFPSPPGQSEVNEILMKCLVKQNGGKFKTTIELGGGLQGVNGQYRKLKPEEYCCIFDEIKSRKNIDIVSKLKSQGVLLQGCDNKESVDSSANSIDGTP